MATAKTADPTTEIDEATLDALIEQDPDKPGRHNARFVEYGTHLWAVLNSLRRTSDDIPNGNIADAVTDWGFPEEAIRAAIRYYERHRNLYDAYFLLQDEEEAEWSKQAAAALKGKAPSEGFRLTRVG